MKAIRYTYTHIMKQLFFIVCFIYALLHFIVMLEVMIFKLPGFYENIRPVSTVFAYAVLFIFIFMLFMQHRFCYSVYDDEQIIYYNQLFKHQKQFSFSDAKSAFFGSRGVKFYTSENPDLEHDKVLFYLPFFRGGIINAIQINNFYKFLKDREDFRVYKSFKVLPGYTKKWKVVAVVYLFLAVILFMNCSTPLTTAIVLFTNH